MFLFRAFWFFRDDDPGDDVRNDSQAHREERGNDPKQTDKNRINFKIIGDARADSTEDLIISAPIKTFDYFCHLLSKVSII